MAAVCLAAMLSVCLVSTRGHRSLFPPLHGNRVVCQTSNQQGCAAGTLPLLSRTLAFIPDILSVTKDRNLTVKAFGNGAKTPVSKSQDTARLANTDPSP